MMKPCRTRDWEKLLKSFWTGLALIYNWGELG